MDYSETNGRAIRFSIICQCSTTLYREMVASASVFGDKKQPDRERDYSPALDAASNAF
jgi:hypothetical protein